MTSSTDPRRSYPTRPVVDEESAAVLEEAVLTLTILRGPMLVGDAGAELHALASLRAQIGATIPSAVAAARDQLVPWHVIARQLGVSTGEARQRYGDKEGVSAEH